MTQKHYYSLETLAEEHGLGLKAVRQKFCRYAARRPRKTGRHWNSDAVFFRIDTVDGSPRLLFVNPQMGGVPTFKAEKTGAEPVLDAPFDTRPWLITRLDG